MTFRHGLAGGLLLGGGVSLAVWGAWSVAGLLNRIATAAPAVDAGSAVFGLPPLGLCLAGFGLIVLVPAGAKRARWPTSGQLFGGTLAMGAMAIALLAAGPWLVDGLMRAQGYRICERRFGVRTSFGHWVADGVACEGGAAGGAASQPTVSRDVRGRNGAG